MSTGIDDPKYCPSLGRSSTEAQFCVKQQITSPQVGLLYMNFDCPRIRFFTALVRTTLLLVILLILLPLCFALVQ
jgi:hypothetical protein